MEYCPTKRASLSFLVVIASVLLATGCQEAQKSEQNGSVEMHVQGLSVNDITSLEITVSGSGINPDIVERLTGGGGSWSGVISNIPAGPDRLFSAKAFDVNSTVIYQGSAQTPILGDQRALVTILLQQANPPTAYSNSAPYISSIISNSARVIPSGSAIFTVSAFDADSDTLTYLWSASDGSFNNNQSSTAVWTAPSYTATPVITIVVSDGKNAPATFSFPILVQPDYGSAEINAGLNNWPVMTSISANSGQVAAGESTSVSVTVSDADNDSLVYYWDQDCSGYFSYEPYYNYYTAPTVSWTAPTSVPSSGVCTISVRVEDGRGGSVSGSLKITVGKPSLTVVDRSTKVLLAAADSPSLLENVKAALIATGSFAQIDAIDISANTPSVETLQNYGVVMSWTNYYPQDQRTFYNNLATYYDNGGRVVLSLFVVGGFPEGPAGGFLAPENGYMLFDVFVANNYSYNTQATIGTIAEPASSLMAGVTNIQTSYYSNEPLLSGATVVASWSNGVPMVVRGQAKGRNRADLNFWPGELNGDSITLIRNALLYK